MKQTQPSIIRTAFTILGTFLILFAFLALIFVFFLKSAGVSADAKRTVDELGRKEVEEVLAQLESMKELPSTTQDTDIVIDITIDVNEIAEATSTEADGTQEDSFTQKYEEWVKQLDENTVKNLDQKEQQDLHAMFEDTIFFGDSMAEAVASYGFLDSSNVFAVRSSTVDVLIEKLPELAKAYPKRVVIFTGLNDCNHYKEIAKYAEDYSRMIDEMRAQIPGVTIVVTSLLPPSDEVGATRPDLARAPQFDQELRVVCQRKNVQYVDSTWIVRQNNYLKDGIHMNRTFYRVWFRYLMVLFG